MISHAENSIWIFTPYLDFTINKLLLNKKDEIDVVIITSLEGDNLFQRGYQLEALKKLISNGTVVKNLSGLHAKILLIDNDSISLGSQNFTSRGRKNKEAGFLSNASFFESDFLKDLNDWNDEAQIVNAELINSLIKYIKDNQDKFSDLKKRFEDDVEAIINEYKFNQEDFTTRQSKIYSPKFRFAQHEAILTKTLDGVNKDHYSFHADNVNDLQRWIKTNIDGKEEEFEIPKHNYFPALNLKNMEMAFLRLHKTRITYMKSGFQIKSGQIKVTSEGKVLLSGLKIKDKMFSVDFRFLKRNTKKSNIKITLSNSELGSTILYLLFDSKNFKIVKHKSNSINCKDFISENFLSNHKQFNYFLREQIMYRYFKTPNDQPAEIEKFLTKDKYKIGILEYKECPVLIFEVY